MIAPMFVVIFVTAGNKKEAREIAQTLIRQKLAACVNILGKVESLFFWESKIDHAQEYLLVIKSKKDKLPKIIKLVEAIHSYEVPEIIALPIIAGSKAYLRWINASLR
ncbi:MAG: divalent-cation tolerance protein CutA [Candidatus Omnitrophota bacterium]